MLCFVASTLIIFPALCLPLPPVWPVAQKWRVILDLWGSANYHTLKNSRLNNQEIIRTSDDVSSNSSCCRLGMEASNWIQRILQLERLLKAPSTRSNRSQRAARDTYDALEGSKPQQLFTVQTVQNWNTALLCTAELCVCTLWPAKRWLTGRVPLLWNCSCMDELATVLCTFSPHFQIKHLNWKKDLFDALKHGFTHGFSVSFRWEIIR